MGICLSCFKPPKGDLVVEAAPNGDMILTHPEVKPTHTLVFLPGWSQSPEDFEGWYFNIQNTPIPKHFRVRIVRSDVRPCTAVGGFKLHAWFDFKKDKFEKEDFYEKEDLDRADEKIQGVLREEAKVFGGDFSKVFIGGFSQGAMVTLYTGLQFQDQKLGGIISLSGLVIVAGRSELVCETQKQTPLCVIHQRPDTDVVFKTAEKSYVQLFEQEKTNNPDNFEYHWLPTGNHDLDKPMFTRFTAFLEKFSQ